MENTFTPLDSPAIYARDGEKVFIPLFLLFLPAAGREDEVKAPGLSNGENFEMGCMWVLLPRFPLQSDYNSNSGSSRTDEEPLDSHHFGGITLSSFLLPIVRRSSNPPSAVKAFECLMLKVNLMKAISLPIQ